MLEDSSGNGGAAVAAYAAAGGMRAKILVPADTSPAKTVQARASGAAIELVPGSRQDCADEALRHGCFRDEERPRDRRGAEAADRAERERDLRLAAERGMAAREEEAQAIGTGSHTGQNPSENSLRSDLGLPQRANHFGQIGPVPGAPPFTNLRPGGP